MPLPPTPELDKKLDVMHSQESPTDTLTRFWDWLAEERIILAQWVEHPDDPLCDGDCEHEELLVPIGQTPNEVFARFFGLDINKMDEEQRSLLRHLGGTNG